MGFNKWMRWIGKEENAEDIFIAFFSLIDLVLVNWLLTFFTSYMNHPARYFSWFETWFIMLPGIVIVPILLIALIVLQIKAARKGSFLMKLFDYSNQKRLDEIC